MMTPDFDYIVVGSGFGGSVAAMRLAEKGYSVAVLEKGKRFQDTDFPKSNWNLKKYLWFPLLRFFGFLRLSFFRETFILSGVGVGGGSLVYANTHMIPPDSFFQHPSWSRYNDWKQVLQPFYDLAKFMLGTTENQNLDREDQVLRDVAKDMGREHTFRNAEVGVYFGDPDDETDPYFSGLGPPRRGCIRNAACMVGCRKNAKNTLEKNYLWFAEKFGAKIFPETLVSKIHFHDGVYTVEARRSTCWLPANKRSFTSRGLVISAGVLGTMDLLLRQKHQYRTLPQLSDKLGHNLRTNSESICGVVTRDFGRKLNNGVSITSTFNPDDKTHVETVKFPDNSNALLMLAAPAAGHGGRLVRTLKTIKRIVCHPLDSLRLFWKRGLASRTIILLVMQAFESSMQMVLKRFPYRRISIQNNGAARVPAYIEIGQQVMRRYAEKVNGFTVNPITEILFNMSTTAHILGGCPMGTSREDGVVDKSFKAFGYPNMVILDGSILQANLGVNPSLTIAALSEFAVSQIPEKAGNTQKNLETLIKEAKQLG